MVKSFQDYIVENTNEITFAFGRFNPPTTGHEKLFEAVKKISRGGLYRVYPTHTQDAKRNPLDFKTKVKYLRKMFPKHARNIMADKGMRTSFNVISALYDQGFTQATMVVGEDRVIEFDKLLNKYNGVKGKHGFYQFQNGVKVVSAGARDPDSDDLTGMSASKMRAAASENDLKAFSKGMPRGFKDVEGLFNAVRSGMGLKESHNHRQHVQLEKVSDLREDYIKGNLFKVDDEVVLKENNEVGTIRVCGSNYVLVEFGTIRKRCWLDSVEKLEEEGGAGEWGTEELVKNYQKDTPGQEKILDFKSFLKDDFKLTPALKIELEKIASKLDMKDFSSKSHKIATAMNILKKKHGYNT
tara:strand:+ start:1167 stop:2231 length:1065 start_codon:yes stop_codon:yes gene_type:complete